MYRLNGYYSKNGVKVRRRVLDTLARMLLKLSRAKLNIHVETAFSTSIVISLAIFLPRVVFGVLAQSSSWWMTWLGHGVVVEWSVPCKAG